ncbi:hypothetical protein Tco_0901354 [Tanacetum coccineum]
MITNNNNKTRGRTLAWLMLQGLVRRNLTEDLNLCAQNATIVIRPNVGGGGPNANKCKFWHLARDCRSTANANTANNQKGHWGRSLCYALGQIDITPSTLDHYYDVELADGRIIRLNQWFLDA